MPSKPITLRFTRHKRSTTSPQCTPLPRDFSKTLTELPISELEHSGSQVLPCGCRRSQVLLRSLDISAGDPSAFFSTATYTCVAPPTPTSLRHKGEVMGGPTCKQEPVWPYPGKFHYYLPHLSSSLHDFYTSQEGVARGVPSPMSPSPPNKYTFGTGSLFYDEDEVIGLPFINEEDFQYYPLGEVGRGGRPRGGRETEKAPMMGDRWRRAGLVKKKAWEGFWLEGMILRGLRKVGLMKR
ncbi:hypothetical protein K505DRAFT_391896 [Melanomma pulvis-pyrius CBS 109.77]|uniref:Uncharacterized protein n=1 Tax=Melanomma pulvis-pyrius CBS 109.77 TaxID=1314802 RepID=A0A6A6X116_9PLEO|nr:hypothetical protein K505DRAFT_391896 [Melanomma pulvis-pyrius CBS 109.77]